MRPLTHAMPGALAELLREAPLSQGKVNFAWQAAVGAGLARVSSARLEGRVIVVEAVDQRWAREIARASDVIMIRLKTLLGADTVDQLLVRDL